MRKPFSQGQHPGPSPGEFFQGQILAFHQMNSRKVNTLVFEGQILALHPMNSLKVNTLALHQVKSLKVNTLPFHQMNSLVVNTLALHQVNFNVNFGVFKLCLLYTGV